MNTVKPPLSVVSDDSPLETIGQRVSSLQAQAKALANEHIRALMQALWAVQSLSSEISEGGDAYPVGVRELAKRLTETSEGSAQTIEAIIGRR